MINKIFSMMLALCMSLTVGFGDFAHSSLAPKTKPITNPSRLLPERAGPTAHISPREVAGQTPAQIHANAQRLGLQPRGPNPSMGRGAYADDAAKFKDGLRPGSYATHARGRPMSGTTAQQKLALPHETPPNSYYKVRVDSSVPVNGPGPVQPTQVPMRPGGGIEYTFPNGTPPGSVQGPFPIR